MECNLVLSLKRAPKHQKIRKKCIGETYFFHLGEDERILGRDIWGEEEEKEIRVNIMFVFFFFLQNEVLT